LHLSPKNGVPLYLQIVSQIKYLVASGRLTAGDEIPPIRVLAEQLLVNPNTVARAYRELEIAGVLTKRQGAGTYVSDAGTPLAWAERQKILRERVAALVTEAHQLDVPVDVVFEMIREQDAELAVREARVSGEDESDE
ncbi:MAG: GntR family transcriptional regulator, partial [Candidatus Hydrogenedentes bacterium]|nr:GntR family transcriptional regulator [Candidatus Hydrogenedentota bacterium]